MIELDPADAVTAHALSVTRAELSPSGADKARLRAALGLPPALPAAGAATDDATADRATACAAAAPALRPAQLASRWWAGALGALLFGSGVATGWLLRPALRPALAPLPAPAVVAPLGTPVAAPAALAARAEASAGAETTAEALPEVARAEQLEPDPARREAPHRPRRAPAVHAAAAPLSAELALLRRVERALRNDDPALALALLSELDARFPQTRLAEERLAARSMAECKQEGPRAAPRARAFLREHPASEPN